MKWVLTGVRDGHRSDSYNRRRNIIKTTLGRMMTLLPKIARDYKSEIQESFRSKHVYLMCLVWLSTTVGLLKRPFENIQNKNAPPPGETTPKASFKILRFFKNWIWTRRMSLSIILSLFLFSGNFEPSYSYKLYSYKKNGVVAYILLHVVEKEQIFRQALLRHFELYDVNCSRW